MNILTPQIEYLLMLQNFREFSNHIFDGFFSFVTTFGEVLIPLLFVALFYWSINKKDGIFMIWNLSLGMLINQFLKLTACIYRPWVLDNRIKPIPSAMKMAVGYSFPSGHAAIATAVWGGFAFLNKDKKILKYGLIILVLLICFSRNFLGVHTPQDVLVSLVLGTLLIFWMDKFLKWIDAGKNRDVIVFCVVFVLNILLIIYGEMKNYPIDYLNGQILVEPDMMKFDTYPKAGYILGILFGWLIDRRFIHFDPLIGTKIARFVRFVVGTVIFCILMCKTHVFFVNIFGQPIGSYINYFIAGCFVTAIYPLAVKSLQSLDCKII